MKKAVLFYIPIILVLLSGCGSYGGNGNERVLNEILSGLTLPDGFTIEVYANNIPGARSMTLSPGGVLYVGTRGEGKVYALLDENKDFKADTVVTVVDGWRSPNGVAYRDGSLYIADIHRIMRFDEIDQNLLNPPDPEIVTESFPTDGHHGWKYIAFGPDGKLYVPVGAPCNICQPEKEIYATITRINPDGSRREIVAHGVRNSVGFDWQPQTGELWFTDNGRDWLGDNRPPGELNHLSKPGMHFGYPYMHGSEIWDPEFGEHGKALDLDFEVPARELGPHVAPLGMHFYTGDMFPGRYQNNIFIAEHGSWNRSEKIGYRITVVGMENGEAVSYEPFIDGWLREDESVWGRPVDVLQLPDGSLLISDDHGGLIYRVTYNNNS